MADEIPVQAFDSERFLKELPSRPGVYRMLDLTGETLYVGKARDLRNRVTSYFRASGLTAKTMALVARIHDIQITLTNSETEALLLEQSLIKDLRPFYNIVLRDDKSYPYIYLTSHAEYPRLSLYRGMKQKKGRYFGPYPSAYAVRESLNILQKLFQIRSCDEHFFKHRARPCLQHQIQRCSAPCVELISPAEYAKDVERAIKFLEGRSNDVLAEYQDSMDAAANELEFERAARYRDQIAHLRRVQESQYVHGDEGDADIVVVAQAPGGTCIQVQFLRQGRMLGSRQWYPKDNLSLPPQAALNAFVMQFYLGTGQGGYDVPREIILNFHIEDAELLALALTEKLSRKVTVSSRVRSQRARWVELAQSSAEQALAMHLADRGTANARLLALQEALDLPEVPRRIECFDISHTGGEATVASCVVFDGEGPKRSDYRRFNIQDIQAGDDYAAMAQALKRRYTRLKQGEAPLPDVLLIDGGQGQLTQAERVLADLQIEGVVVIGVAKGPTRKAGLETLILANSREVLELDASSSALHLIQHVRDEAHRFAITGHRARRGKTRVTSELDELVGVGPARRKALLRHFGGIAGLRGASVDEIGKVKGIDRKLALSIYAQLHNH